MSLMQRSVRWLLALAVVCLGLGLTGGLARLGWLSSPVLAAGHGPLMLGFLGGVIALERAVGLGLRWALLAPLLAWLGTGLAVAGLPEGRPIVALGSLGLVLACGAVLRLRADMATGTMALGAVAWLIGNVLWATGSSVPQLVSWWMAFPVLTIAGERLELAAMRRPPVAARVLFGLFALLTLAPATQGAGFLGLALWLLRFDLAWRTVRQPGRTRYIAVCLLSGYGWLLAGGTLLSSLGLPAGGPLYDAILHSVLLGFVMAMIFGHALLIVPALTGLAIPYRPWLYLPLGLLHLTTAARLAADFGGAARAQAGLGNVLALLAFGLALAAARRSR